MNNDELVLNFFQGTGSDSSQRTINDILAFNESDIESVHNFIQWVFPTSEISAYNPNAPTISNNFKHMLSEHKDAQKNFCQTCLLFLDFFGFECPKTNKNKLPSYKNTFLSRPRHNLLRITRVLNSLNQVGKESCSMDIFSQIKDYYRIYPQYIPIESYRIWEATQQNK